MWFWPYGASAGSEVSFVPGAGLAENLRRFWAFHLTTSLGWDLPRALMNSVMVLLLGTPLLLALRRIARKAAFGAPVEFDEPAPSAVVEHQD
jgi:energy-coupling factor transport system substrate-specific component